MRLPIFLSLLLPCLLPVLAPRANADTVFHYLSESGDSIGSGLERTLTPANGSSFQVGGDSSHVAFNMYKSDPNGMLRYYSIGFTAPNGTTLAVGDYPNAVLIPTPGDNHPGLSFFAQSSSSSTTGQFKIFEISFDAAGNLETFAANFADHFVAGAPTTFGEIRYNSSIPYLTPAGAAQLSTDAYTVFETDGQLTVNVTRREGSTGPLQVDYTTTDGTAQAGRDYVATSGTLAWADGDAANKTFTVPLLHPGDPERGNLNFLLRLTGSGAGVQNQAKGTIVTDDSAVTFLHYQSDIGDFLGQGQERTLSIANKFVVTASRDYSGGVSFSIDDHAYTKVYDEEEFTLDFNTPTGTVFGVGDYQNAVSYSQPGQGLPQLNFAAEGRGGTAQASNFQVLEAVFDGDGQVLRFAANFELHNSGKAPALHGQVRYHSTVPLPPERLPQVGVSIGDYVVPSISDTSGIPGIFTFTRTGNISQPLAVSYMLSGTGVSGQDYRPLKGTHTIKAGKATAQVKLVAIHTGTGLSRKTVKLTVEPQAGRYDAASTGPAKIKIDHQPY